jgi:Capsular polysaccharide synthesis protein
MSLGDAPREAVWTYWEDGPRSKRAAYLDLCLETIRRQGPPLEVNLIGRDDASKWLPDLDVERWEELPAPNYRSDYVRSRLLQRYGGVWIDIDTIALAPLSTLLSEVDEAKVVCWGHELGRCFTNLVAAAPGAQFVDAWVEEQDRMLDRSRDWSQLDYSALAQDIAWGVSRRCTWKSFQMRRVAPVPWYQWRRFFSRLQSPRRLTEVDPVTVVLWNAVMAPRLRRYDRALLLSSRILLARLLRIALGMSRPANEDDALARLHVLSELRFHPVGQRVESALRRATKSDPL